MKSNQGCEVVRVVTHCPCPLLTPTPPDCPLVSIKSDDDREALPALYSKVDRSLSVVLPPSQDDDDDDGDEHADAAVEVMDVDPVTAATNVATTATSGSAQLPAAQPIISSSPRDQDPKRLVRCPGNTEAGLPLPLLLIGAAANRAGLGPGVWVLVDADLVADARRNIAQAQAGPLRDR